MKKPKKNILIIFEGIHLAFSPTTLVLFKELNKQFNTYIYASKEAALNNIVLDHPNILYYNNLKGLKRILLKLYYNFIGKYFSRDINYFKSLNFDYQIYYKLFKELKNGNLSKIKFNKVIAIDISNLFIATKLEFNTDFLSLELCNNEYLLNKIDTNSFNNVIIQSEERYNYLFPNIKKNLFLVQNAPIYKDIELNINSKKSFLFGGTAKPEFGIFHCIDYILKYNEVLVIKGAVPKNVMEVISKVYKKIVDEGKLILDSNYLDDDLVVDYFKQFEIGFCFYDLSFPHINNMNYITAPSGKLFKYLAAGVPVICNDLIGFKFVKEFECGILIDDFTPHSINEAVEKIRSDYKTFCNNALKAAKYYSFDKSLDKYLNAVKAELEQK